MRVALLSLLEGAAPQGGGARGYLRIGGQSLARHQLGLALALGCTRIVVIAEALSGELVSIQHAAEGAGAQFHVIAAPRALVGLVAPEDELVVLADGLLAMPDEAVALLGAQSGVLVLGVEQGLPAGFERIDINRAGAGAMRIPGRIVAGLGDLPGDWDASSALLRLAMQAGVRQVALPAALLESGRWALVRSEEEAHALEPRWLRLHTASSHRRGPGEAVATLLVHWLGPAVLHAGTRPLAIVVAAWVMGLLGLGLAWLGTFPVAFVLFGIAWLTRKAGSLLARIERDSIGAPGTWVQIQRMFSWGLDLAFVVVASWRSELWVLAAAPPGAAIFAPAVLFGLLRLLPAVRPGAGWARLLEDRALAALVLAGASLSTGFDAAMMASVAVLLGLGLLNPAQERGNVPNPPLTRQR